jgi:hypothetical protein
MDARLRGRALSNAIDILFESLSRMPQLTTAQIRDRIRTYFQEELNKSLELAYDLPLDPAIDVAFEITSLKERVVELRAKLAAQSFSAVVISDAKELLASLDKPTHAADSDALSHAANGVLRAKIESARILAAMLTADYGATAPLDPLFAGMEPTGLPPIPGEAAVEPPNERTLANVGSLYIAFHVNNWAKKTTADQQRVLALAEAVIGATKLMRKLDVEDVKAVRDSLARLPPNYIKATANKGLSVIDAIKGNQAGVSLSLKTQDKYFSMFKSLLIWARNEGYAEAVPGGGVKVAGVGKLNPADRRNPYSVDQLAAIFTSPLYKGHADAARLKPGPNAIRDGKFGAHRAYRHFGYGPDFADQLLLDELCKMLRSALQNVGDDERQRLVSHMAEPKAI